MRAFRLSGDEWELLLAMTVVALAVAFAALVLV